MSRDVYLLPVLTWIHIIYGVNKASPNNIIIIRVRPRRGRREPRRCLETEGVRYMMKDLGIISMLDDTEQPSTILHKVIQQRILELNSKLRDQQATESFSNLSNATKIDATTWQLSKPVADNERLPLRHESTFDLWQQDVLKYLKVLQK